MAPRPHTLHDELEREIGFDAVGAVPLKNARLLEPLGYLNIQLGYGLKMGTDTDFRFDAPLRTLRG